MKQRPPARFYVVGFASLALLIVGLVLTATETIATIAPILSLLGALGMFACWWMLRRQQERF
jgi:uncharacterized membrane protein YqjE